MYATIRRIRTGAGAALVALHVSACFAEDTAKSAAPAKSVQSAETAAPAVRKNPFAYNGSQDERGLVPTSTARLPHGIILAAVLIPKEGAAVAVLRLPDSKSPVFVRENDLISINPALVSQSAKGRTTHGVGTGEAPFYLLIKSISEEGVEVAPRVRPTEVHLLR